MKSLKAIVVAIALVVIGAMPAAAQFNYGIRAGVNISDLSFNDNGRKLYDAENRAGWTAGIIGEFTVPIIGIGADLSAMYVHRTSDFAATNNIPSNKRDYIEIPLNLKYKFTLPVVSNFLVPYIAVGPSVSFLTSKKSIENAYTNKSVDWAINAGIGLRIINHLDINARYGWGLTKAVNFLSQTNAEAPGIDAKNRYWTVTLGWLF